MYDLILTLSTYKSVHITRSFLDTLHYLGENVLAVLVGPIEDELRELAEGSQSIPAVFIQSDINSLHFGRAWGFAWAVNNGLKARYLASCDDDLEWIPMSEKILPRLDQAEEEIGWCLMGFQSTHPTFPNPYQYVYDEFLVDYGWLDGNCIFSKWDDNLEYGVIDSTVEAPQVFYIEIEYAHRMRFLTERPIIFDLSSDAYYRHLFRTDPAINAERGKNAISGMGAGNHFWQRKFGIEALDFERSGGKYPEGIHEWIYETTIQKQYQEDFKKHMLFDGLWNDWVAIYDRFVGATKVIYDNH